MSAGELDTRVARLEERLAWFERHVAEQDKAMMELSDLVERMRREVLALRERSAGSAGAGGVGDAGAAELDERPPHY
ncbi:SlyX protein [Nibricoccus aquaticus]|uniref:SlyX protein n=1 Tax=Nibricoccus aquaticus TaxID=2576891 RepID=A0A290QGJ9_9BACT|nr:SlyX family protein [Nibricoccus aquaticus]ATC63461.1 SlyX protein [Nibricoccus aquaticus]